nr:FtsX-like permease family protein [Eubacterium sp.]
NTDENHNSEEVMNNINIHVKNIKAVRTQNMLDDVSGKLMGISGMAGGMIVLIWILVFIIMMLAFAMICNERRKEFAVIRLVGASRGGLAGLIFKETMMISLTGSLLGALFAYLVVELFSNLIQNSLQLPFLLPEGGEMFGMIVGAIGVTVAAASLASALCAGKISRIDAAIILRGEN